MSRPIRLLAIFGMAGLLGVAARRQFRHRHAGQRTEMIGRRPLPDPSSRHEDPDDKPPDPPLSPGWFSVTHFGLLVLLTAIVAGGLTLRGIHRYPPGVTWHVDGGDVDRGRAALIAYGCGSCHVIPGIRQAGGRVGPPLVDFAQRMYIGGQLTNTPEHLIAWLQDPRRYAPGTAMPNLAVTAPDARDMAAYLYADH